MYIFPLTANREKYIPAAISAEAAQVFDYLFDSAI